MIHYLWCIWVGFEWIWVETRSDVDSSRRKKRVDLAIYRCSRCDKRKVEPFTRDLR